MAAQQSRLNLKHSTSEVEIRKRVRLTSTLPAIDRTIVAIGATGAGKSTLLNILAGKKVFAATGGAKGCTKKVQKKTVKFQTSTFALIDTPGLLDPETLDKAIARGAKTHVLLSQQCGKFAENLEEALHEAGKKVDAVLLVFNAENRWSVEAEWVVDILNTIRLAYRHIIVVFTHGASLGKTNAERCAEMKKRLSNPKAVVYGLTDLFNKLEQEHGQHQESGQ